MKKKLSLLLAVVFIMTLAFGILPTAGAVTDPAHNHGEELKPGHHWDCTLVSEAYETTPSCGLELHTHGPGCYQQCTRHNNPDHWQYNGFGYGGYWSHKDGTIV